MFKTMMLVSISLISSGILNAQTTITGKLFGHDGKPMGVENVTLSKPSDGTTVKTIAADKDGKYTITADSAGVWMLTFAGVNHSSHQVALYVDKPETLHLDVQLKTYDYVDTVKKVGIEGDFNNFNMRSPVPMQRQEDGTFATEIETKADSLAYEIVGITKDGHTINGTQSERNVYDGGGDYWSVVTPVQGKVRVIFDPAKLVKSNEPEKIKFTDSLSIEAQFASVYENMMREQDDYTRDVDAYLASGKNMQEFKYDLYWSKEVKSVAARLDKENNPILRQGLYINYFFLGLNNAKLDSSIVKKALMEIPPFSIVWSLNPSTILPLTVQRFSVLSEIEQDSYAQRVLATNSDVMVKSQLLYFLCEQANRRHDTMKATAYYNLLKDKYGSTEYAREAKMRFAPDLKVAVGKPVPSFSIPSLEDSIKVFTNESFKGKFYMIDFWATWCGPCVREMESLHRAYSKFKDKNFAILSVSLDGSPQDVSKFRRDKWQMPWLHAFADQSWENKMVKEFEVWGIPRPILVDPTGKIVAMEEDLRGESLEKTLEKYLGK